MIHLKLGYFILLISLLQQFSSFTSRHRPQTLQVDTIKTANYQDKLIMLNRTGEEENDNKLFYKCNFQGGLILGGAHNVTFQDCTFKNVGVILGGRNKDIGSQFGTKNITFINCKFDSVTENGIVTRRNNYDHRNLIIKNCVFSNWGIHNKEPCIEVCNDEDCDPNDCSKRCNCKRSCERCSDPYNKFDHAIYMRANNYLIEGNTFLHTTGGAAISCRTAGAVINNKVVGSFSGVGVAMEYWPHKKWGSGGLLQIEGNQFVEPLQNLDLLQQDVSCECSNAGRAVLLIKSTKNKKTVDSLIVRYNTIVLEQAEAINEKFKPVQISTDFNHRFAVVYGNAIADFTGSSMSETSLMPRSHNFYTLRKTDFRMPMPSDSTGTQGLQYTVSPKSLAYKLLSREKLLKFAQLIPIYKVQDKSSAGNP